MKFTRILLLLLAFPFLLSGRGQAQTKLLKMSRDGKLGMIDLQGNFVIAPQYDLIYTTDDHIVLAKNVRGQSRYGMSGVALADLQGNILIPPGKFKVTHNRVRSFGNGYDVVQVGTKYGVIDAKGNFLLEARYQKLQHMETDGLLAFWVGNKVGLMTLEGEEVMAPAHSYPAHALQAYRDARPRPAEADLKIKVKPDSQGKLRVAELIDPDQPHRGGRMGFVNQSQDWVIGPMYDQVREFRHGFAVVSKDQKVGIVDPHGNMVVDLDNHSAYVLGKNRFLLVIRAENSENYYTKIVNRKGRLLNEYHGLLENPTVVDGETYFVYSLDGRGQFYMSSGIGLVRASDGKVIVEPVYDFLRHAGEGKFVVVSGCECDDETAVMGLCTVEGMGYTAVARNCKFGIVDHKGQLIFEPQFDGFAEFRNGKAYALKDNVMHLMTAEGADTTLTDIRVEPQQSDHFREAPAIAFRSNYGGARPDGYFIHGNAIVHQGRKISPPLTTEKPPNSWVRAVAITHERDDIYRLNMPKNEWGYVRLPGRELISWSSPRIPPALREWTEK